MEVQILSWAFGSPRRGRAPRAPAPAPGASRTLIRYSVGLVWNEVMDKPLRRHRVRVVGGVLVASFLAAAAAAAWGPQPPGPQPPQQPPEKPPAQPEPQPQPQTQPPTTPPAPAT